MLQIRASKILVVEDVEDEPRMRERMARLLPFFDAAEVRTVDDAALNEIVASEIPVRPLRHHGITCDTPHLVIFNRFRFDDPPEERERRRREFPALFAEELLKFQGYGGFDRRESGSPAHRRETGLVCQPAWHLHAITGCPFRCAYCFLGWHLNIPLNVEEWLEHVTAGVARAPEQTLFQYDNWTDPVCFEPEYGATRMLVEWFAQQPGQALELYAGKSDNVDFLLDYDHRGHTVCCWSLTGRTQARELEARTASLAGRIDAMRKCQAAGYAVRARLSPIVPTRGWRQELRELLAQLFRDVRPDLLTIESIRYLDYDELAAHFDLSLLDEEFVAALREARGQPCQHGLETPHAWRAKIYEFIFGELQRVRPETPVAFCRESFEMWAAFADRLAPHGQQPGDYRCNCGPRCAPAGAAAQR